MLPAPPLSPPRLLLLPTVAAAAAAPWNSNSCGAAKPSSLSFAPPTPPRICTLRGSSRRRCFCARSKLDTDGGWEDLADGYGSEYEELEQEEDEGEGSGDGEQSGLAAIVNSYTMDSCNEELIKEVEQLLSPEEKASLQQNEAPDLNKISTKKWSAFHSLALSAQMPFMDKLLELGVDIDSADKDGFTVLHKAVMGKKEAVISHLLRKGANPHLNDRDGATPLHYAVQVGAMQTVKLLIKYKVDINVADNEGWTPLHVAIQSRSRDIAKVLLINGADKTRRNKVSHLADETVGGRCIRHETSITGDETHDGKRALDLCLCYGRDFKSYELAKLLKLVPANRDP